jgi:hypothetical protein
MVQTDFLCIGWIDGIAPTNGSIAFIVTHKKTIEPWCNAIEIVVRDTSIRNAGERSQRVLVRCIATAASNASVLVCFNAENIQLSRKFPSARIQKRLIVFGVT